MKTLLTLAFLLLSASAFAGTCPSGSTYGPNQNQTLSQAWGITSCFYIASNGLDSNAGADETHPWLHAPGMPNCNSGPCGAKSTNCGASAGNCNGVGFIFRGGDTWHFASGSPAVGGVWSFPWGSWGSNASGCNWQNASNATCIYYGVDQTWFSGGSWARPILNGDNPTSASPVASCSVNDYSAARVMYLGVSNIFDNFEVTGFCTNSGTVVLDINNTGNGGTGTTFLENLYIHGWSVTTSYYSGAVVSCVMIGGGFNGLMGIDHIVVDGSDSKAGACAWGTFPSFYHFKDSMIRFTTQGVGQWCHDIHDNIFEHFANPLRDDGSAVTHGNMLECNSDSTANAAFQPQNTPNVVYNNIGRHDASNFNTGNPRFYFSPAGAVNEYWFNNIEYDLTAGLLQNWDIDDTNCPANGTSCNWNIFMFNNTILDTQQPCAAGGHFSAGGPAHLNVYNEHLINSAFSTPATCVGHADSSNILMSDATATSQGYTTGSGGGGGGTNTCANDTTTPCSPTAAGNGTVGKAINQTAAYCATLATFSSEPAIGTDAANACKFGTTDGCAYNSSTHTMSCPAQTAQGRPSGGAWDSGAYEFGGGGVQPPPAPAFKMIL